MKELLISAIPFFAMLGYIILQSLAGGCGKPGDPFHVPSWWETEQEKRTRRKLHKSPHEWSAADRKEWWDKRLRPYRGQNKEANVLRWVLGLSPRLYHGKD